MSEVQKIFGDFLATVTLNGYTPVACTVTRGTFEAGYSAFTGEKKLYRKLRTGSLDNHDFINVPASVVEAVKNWISCMQYDQPRPPPRSR